MYTRLKLIFITLVGVPLIALCIAGRVTPLASFSHSSFQFDTGIEQGYQPPSTIGAPSRSLGSGTR